MFELSSYNTMYPHIASSNTYMNLDNKPMFNVCGVYMIYNIVNGKYYIGSSGSVYNRITVHLGGGKGSIFNKMLLRKEFVDGQLPIFNVCLLFKLPYEYFNIHLLREIELYFIEKLNPEYNAIKPKFKKLYMTDEIEVAINNKLEQIKLMLPL